jgi:hypothetical protein
MPVPPVVDLPVETAVPFESQLPFDSSSLSMPLMLEGTVESFDPALRAADLATNLPRQWCGTYRAFPDGVDQTVSLSLSSLRAYGQMVDVRGAMTVGAVTTPVQGNLNAKSDQLNLIPLADTLTANLESGGAFLGLQGFGLSGWQGSRLTNPGGRLSLSAECVSEALPIRGLW